MSLCYRGTVLPPEASSACGMAGDELAIVSWLKERQGSDPNVHLGIGDDMAVVVSPTDRILLSCDMLLDGVHFDAGVHDWGQIGRKAVNCSLSDCAAMAVRPVAVLVSVAAPFESKLEDVKALLDGAVNAASDHGVSVVGGDTTRWAHPLAVDTAVMANPWEGIAPVTRSGARAGDRLFVTGLLGGSLVDHHLSFTPRLVEARALATSLGNRLHAMIDISDGLAIDLGRMCESSGVGATLSECSLLGVISEDARRMSAADGRTPLDHALIDGEDFELLLAVDGDAFSAGVTLHEIGSVTSSGLRLRRLNHATECLEPLGFVH